MMIPTHNTSSEDSLPVDDHSCEGHSQDDGFTLTELIIYMMIGSIAIAAGATISIKILELTGDTKRGADTAAQLRNTVDRLDRTTVGAQQFTTPQKAGRTNDTYWEFQVQNTGSTGTVTCHQWRFSEARKTIQFRTYDAFKREYSPWVLTAQNVTNTGSMQPFKMESSTDRRFPTMTVELQAKDGSGMTSWEKRVYLLQSYDKDRENQCKGINRP